MTHVTPAIAEEYHQYFDAIWLQPVARDSGGVSSGGVDCDPDRLEVAAAYARSSWQASAPASRFGGVGINIERTGDLQESTAGYGRLLDYLAYGKKYGYVGLTKCYYDGTRHWHSAHSSDRILREQYDALHEFIGAGRGGYIVNGRFETTDGSRLFGWSGEYDVGFPSSSLEREHRWMNQAPGDLARSEFPIGVGPDRMVKIKFESREVTADGTDHSALVGLEFFDGSGHEVRQGSSNLNWSEYLDMWYRYVNTETSWNTWQWSFLVPSNAEYAVLHLRNWSTSATIQWDNVQGFENAPEDFLDDWHDQGPFTISEGSRPLFRRSTITVGSRLAWTIRAQVKETRDDGDPTSGLVRVDVFDGNGTLITPSEGVVAGLAWSDTYGWWYRYIPIDTDQTPSPPYENVWTDWSESFVLPGNAVSFRVYVYRWTLDDDNAIQVRGLRVLSTP